MTFRRPACTSYAGTGPSHTSVELFSSVATVLTHVSLSFPGLPLPGFSYRNPLNTIRGGAFSPMRFFPIGGAFAFVVVAFVAVAVAFVVFALALGVALGALFGVVLVGLRSSV